MFRELLAGLVYVGAVAQEGVVGTAWSREVSETTMSS